jgi:Na+-translocating ferredoxin:NAD+ oxidoreductase RnfG subunit
VLLTSLCTVFLSFTNALYQGVQAGRQRELRMKIWTAFGENPGGAAFDSEFAESVSVKEAGKNRYYTYAPRSLAALHLTGPGLWGDIELLLIIDYGNKTIRELSVLSQIETPGLGARISEQAFLDQFRGLDYSLSVRVTKARQGRNGEVDAVSGATKTSASLESIINRGLEAFPSIAGKEATP